MNKVGVVIVTYNKAQQLEALLSGLAVQTLKPNEVIVIDNASDDNTAEVVARSCIPVRYVHNSANLGSAGGFKDGMRLACKSNDFIWVLDDDVRVAPSALEMAVAGMEGLIPSGNVGAVRSWGKSVCTFNTPKKTGGFAWRGTLFRREAVEAIGLPRSDYFLYGEDMEYSWRMVKKGYSIYWIPNSLVIEDPTTAKMKLNLFGNQRIIHKDPYRLYYANRNQINVLLEYRDIKGIVTTLLYSIKAILLFGIIERCHSFERIKAIILGMWDGFNGRLGINNRYLPTSGHLCN